MKKLVLLFIGIMLAFLAENCGECMAKVRGRLLMPKFLTALQFQSQVTYILLAQSKRSHFYPNRTNDTNIVPVLISKLLSIKACWTILKT
jgi:hypothetical protein